MGYAAKMIGRAYHGSARGLSRALLWSQRACAGLGRRYVVVLPSYAERAGKTPPCLRTPAEGGEEYVSLFFTASRSGDRKKCVGSVCAGVNSYLRHRPRRQLLPLVRVATPLRSSRGIYCPTLASRSGHCGSPQCQACETRPS